MLNHLEVVDSMMLPLNTSAFKICIKNFYILTSSVFSTSETHLKGAKMVRVEFL